MSNNKLILNFLIAVICLLLVSSVVLAAPPPTKDETSPSTGASSTGGMVTLFGKQLIPEDYLIVNEDDFFTVDKCSEATKSCWDVSGGKVVFYDENSKKITKEDDMGYHDNLDYTGDYFTDAAGVSHTQNGDLYIKNNVVYVYDPSDKSYPNEGDSLPSGVNVESISGIKKIGSNEKHEISILVEGAEEGISDDFVYVGETKLTREEFNEFNQQQLFSAGVESTDEGSLKYGPDDDQGTISINRQKTNTIVTHNPPTGDGSETTKYNDGTVKEISGDQVTVTLEDGTSISGDLIHDYPESMVVKDGVPQGQIIVSENGDEITYKSFSNGNMDNPTTTYSANFDDQGDVEKSITKTYDTSDNTYRIASDSGTIGDTSFQTTYSSKKETISGEEVTVFSAQRTYNDESGQPIAIQSSNPTSPWGELDEGATIYIKLEEEDRDGEVQTYYGTISSEDMAKKGEVTSSDITVVDITDEESCGAECQQQFKNLDSEQASYQRQESWNNIKSNALGVLEKGAVGRFSGLSNLFFSAIGHEQWIRDVDAWYSRNVLNQDAWVSSICYASTLKSLDLQSDGVAIIENSAGTIKTVANIFAEMTHSDALLCVRNTDENIDEEFTCPEGLYCAEDGFCYNEENDERAEGYFYKISWGVQAPADEAATPNVDENSFAVEYNVVVAGNRLYVDEYGDNHPLKLVNGDKDGQVITWWSNNNYEGGSVCIDWSDETDIYTTGGSAGIGFTKGTKIDDVCNTIVYSEKTTVSMNAYGPAGSTTSGVAEESTTTNDVSFNTNW